MICSYLAEKRPNHRHEDAMMILRKNSAGFTLIELMIVVVIIGILAALATPRFMAASTKTKQSEAKLILKQIYVNERTFRHEGGSNAYYIPAGTASAATPNAFNLISIELAPSARYSFTVEAVGNGFLATARGNIDDDVALDTWTIDDAGNLECTCDDVMQVVACT
jgi:prepilin-type N-terminal cleavage/methylation domain-containing protein